MKKRIAIRGVFGEGDRIFPNYAIFDLAHVQIAIRDTFDPTIAKNITIIF